MILDIDSSVHVVHSDNKEKAAGTYDGQYGFHPMYCFADWTGEPLAARLRRGNAAANQVSDMVEVLDAAIAALPERMRVGHSVGDDEALVEYPIWVRADCAAGPSFAAECRERNVGVSFVAQASDRIAEALSHIPVDDPRWQPALPQPKPTQHNGDGNEPQASSPDSSQTDDSSNQELQPVRAEVIEVTHHVKAYRWPDKLRLIVRREPKHPDAKRSLLDSDNWSCPAFVDSSRFCFPQGGL